MRATGSVASYPPMSCGRSRTRLEAIDEEILMDEKSSRNLFTQLHTNWLTHASREPLRKQLSRGNSFDDEENILLRVVDVFTKGFSLVCLEICKGFLVVALMLWIVMCALCVGLYVHMYQLELF